MGVEDRPPADAGPRGPTAPLQRRSGGLGNGFVTASTAKTHAGEGGIALGQITTPEGSFGAIFGLFGWEWRRLKTQTVSNDAGPYLKASTNVFPQAVAVGIKK